MLVLLMKYGLSVAWFLNLFIFLAHTSNVHFYHKEHTLDEPYSEKLSLHKHKMSTSWHSTELSLLLELLPSYPLHHCHLVVNIRVHHPSGTTLHN